MLAAVHVVAIWHRYAVGSFDDDANYILTARALLAGQGITGHLVSGDVVVAGYPPGFPLLLIPIEWAFHGSFTALRLASAVSYLAVIPLIWHYLGRRGVAVGLRAATVVLIALNPVLGTFSTMVMAETPFLLCSLLLLVAVDRWAASERAVDPTGLAVVILAGGAIWLKEAGAGLVVGLVVWLALRRELRRALLVAGSMIALLVPVAIGRLASGVPLLGTRYSTELGGYYGGGVVGRLVHVLPAALATYVTNALPRSILPFGSPFPQTLGWFHVYEGIGVVISALTVAGFVVTVRHFRDVAVVAVPVYVFETLLWPEVNERRVVLILPLLLAWFAIGSWWAAKALVGVTRSVLAARGRRAVSVLPPLAPVHRMALGAIGLAVAAVAVVMPLGRQFPRDYLFALGVDSSQPQGSRYMDVLRSLGEPSDTVETDYRFTTALFTGHVTAWNAFQNTQNNGCSAGTITSSLAGDRAAYLLLGAVNKPGTIDSPCLLQWASSTPASAVRLLRTSRDLASVFELIGPGTAHPDLTDLTANADLAASGGLADVAVAPSATSDVAGSAVQTVAAGRAGRISWTWPTLRPLSQVSVGEAGALRGRADGVDLQILLSGGVWETVAYSTTAVGDGEGSAPFLLATLPVGTRAHGVRVVVHGHGPVVALDVHALGATGSHG